MGSFRTCVILEIILVNWHKKPRTTPNSIIVKSKIKIIPCMYHENYSYWSSTTHWGYPVLGTNRELYIVEVIVRMFPTHQYEKNNSSFVKQVPPVKGVLTGELFTSSLRFGSDEQKFRIRKRWKNVSEHPFVWKYISCPTTFYWKGV